MLDIKRIREHFDEVKAELREMGFKRFCTFEKMKPVFHRF